MQDRFRFRYYDKNTKCIYTIKPITNTCENGKDIRFYGILISGIGQLSTVECDNQENLIKMQCTGLKDKNGKLIYEGDICRYDDSLAVIEWDSVNCGYSINIDNFSYTFDSFFEDELEVIGNIYDNPELINDK